MSSLDRLQEVTSRNQSFLDLAVEADRNASLYVQNMVKEILLHLLDEKKKGFLDGKIGSDIVNTLLSGLQYSNNPNLKKMGENASRELSEFNTTMNTLEQNLNKVFEKIDTMSTKKLFDILKNLHKSGLEKTVNDVLHLVPVVDL